MSRNRSWSVANALLVLVALAAFGFAAALAVRPEVVPPEAVEIVVRIEDAVETRQVVIGIAAVLSGFALWRSYFSGATDVRDAGIDRGRDRGSTTAADVDVVGEATSERVEHAIESLKRGRRVAAETDAIREDLRATLRAVETAKGRPEQAAAERIRGGEWTDDRVAAVFLGDESAGRLSIWHRLRRWLFPARTFDRRLERTLDELERYASESEFEMTAHTDGESSAEGESEDESANENETESQTETEATHA